MRFRKRNSKNNIPLKGEKEQITMNDVRIFDNANLGIQVRTILNPDGSVLVNAEDTAIGFGWVDNSKFATSGENYVRWARMNKF